METTETTRMGPEESAKVGELYLKYTDKLRTLAEACALAKEMGLHGQVALYESEIKNVSKRWKIDHQNPYLEVSRDDARESFCEPSRRCEKHSAVDCRPCRLRDQPFAKQFKWELWTEKVDVIAPKEKTAAAYLQYLRDQQPAPSLQGLSGQLGGDIYRYLSTNAINFGTAYRADPILYPMGAMLKLKEAMAKNLFDSFECWRPISREEKLRLEDPWLVGVIDDGKARYFKIADWR